MFPYIILGICVMIPVYTYIIYPLILMLFPSRRYVEDESYFPMVSVLVAAYNEEKFIQKKVENLLTLQYPKDRIEFLIASDGSSDRTMEILNSFGSVDNLRILDLPRGGKVTALNAMLEAKKGEILVFSDANTMYERNAIQNIVKHFADERIGCVSGQLRYKMKDNAGEGARSESAYWKYENWVKVQESKIGRLSGANGAIYAIRKGILDRIPKNIINDDFYVATYALQAGNDVIMEPNAVAYEEPNDDFQSQFKRHIRDGAGHYQALHVFWRMLLPRKGSFVHISHRAIKWIVPFDLILLFLMTSIFAPTNIVMSIIFLCQCVGYAFLTLYYLLFVQKDRVIPGPIGKVISIVFYFFAINLSLLMGWFRLISKKQKATWETQR